MALFRFAGEVVVVTYEHRSAVIQWERGQKTYYSVIHGVTDVPEADIRWSRWAGNWDNLGGTPATNMQQEGAHPAARTMLVDILAITEHSSVAYWMESQAAEWGCFKDRWRNGKGAEQFCR